MKRFARELLAFIGVQVVLAGVVLGVFYHSEPGTSGALNPKFERLETIPPPRLVLVGGSNVWYGIDSVMLEHLLGLPTINMGICAPTTLDFQVAITRSRLRRHDVVVISPEYHSWWLRYGDRPDNDLILQIIENTPEALRYLDWNQTKTALDRLLLGRVGYMLQSSVRSAVNREPERAGRDFMNEYGDFTAHRRRPPLGGFPQKPLRRIPEDERIRRTIGVLNRFHASCERDGIGVYLSYPPLPEDYFDSSLPVITIVEERLAASLTIPRIDTPRSVTQPADRFFDSPYHPMFEGTVHRTTLLARSLGTVLGRQLNPRSLWHYLPGETVSLSDEGAEYHLLNGWRERDRGWRKTMGATAEIQFDLETVTSGRLSLQWRAPRTTEPIRIDVILNDFKLGTLLTQGSKATVSSFELADGLLQRQNRLLLTCSNPEDREMNLEVEWFRLDLDLGSE